MSIFLPLLAALAAEPAAVCPSLEGVWALARNERVMVMEQEGCRLSGTVHEPRNNVLRVRGFWRGSYWTMAASRVSANGCGTTAWGTIRKEAERMLVNVLGTDGLCRDDGAPGKGPAEFDFTMIYLRKDAPPPRGGS